MLSDAKNALYGPRHEKELRDREPMIPKSHLTSFGEVYRHSSSLETAATNQFMSAGKREDVEGARTARALREAAKQLRRTDGSLRWERAPDAASTSGSTALPESLALP
jgi:hypothetical protein